MADLDLGDVADANRGPVLGSDDDLFDLIHVRRPPDAGDEEHLIAITKVAAAGVSVVPLHSIDDFIKRELVAVETLRIETDLILLLIATPAIHLGRPLHGAQLWLDDPVVDRPQIGQIRPLAGDDIMEHFAQTRRDRSHLRALDADRQLGRGEPFVDELPSEIDVRAIHERDHDL